MKRKNSDPEYNMGDDSIGFSAKWTFIVGVVIVIVIIIGALAFGAIKPTLLNMESEANRNSPQYVESKVTHLQALLEDYQRLDREIADFGDSPQFDQSVSTRRSQQVSILSEMHSEAALIDEEFIPDNIKAFLDQHPVS